MRKLTSLIALCTIVALSFAPLPASATSVSECQGDIATLLLQTQGTTFSGGVGNKAEQCQAKCEALLLKASKDVDQARFADAIVDMVAYKTSVAFCGSKGFVVDVDVATLTAAADVVITCIQQIGQ
jgi:hypothetical protein